MTPYTPQRGDDAHSDDAMRWQLNNRKMLVTYRGGVVMNRDGTPRTKSPTAGFIGRLETWIKWQTLKREHGDGTQAA